MPSPEIDVSELENRLAPRGIAKVRRLAGGASSLTYSGTIGGGRRIVIKVAPPGVVPILNRDVLRQARLMRALHGSAVAVPDVLWEDGGDPPEVPPLFVMSFVDGTSMEPLFDVDAIDADADADADADGDEDEDEAVVAERMRNAARVLAALHAIDPRSIGLGDEPRVGVDDEIGRWCRLLGTVDPDLVPGWEEVASALRAGEVATVPDAVVHGDFRLGNVLAVGAEVSAVVDWEIWTVGDPRIDLGWFLVNADPATYGRATRYAASLPTPAELTGIYADALGRDVPDVELFQALACFKSSATWSLIVKHNRRRVEPDPALEDMATVLPHLLQRAHDLLS
jgi:aminoglycoside phosphotransferase (APT) family kinase protein